MLRESLAHLGLKITLQTMPMGHKRSLLTQKQVDMAVYDWRPWVPDTGYCIYFNWLPDSCSNSGSYANPEAQTLGNAAITMAVDAPERQATLRRLQDMVHGDIGLVPLLNQLDIMTMREH